MNSYMLPHGTRFGSAAIPRPTMATKCTATAMIVSSTPSRPNIATRSGRSGVTGAAGVAGLPASGADVPTLTRLGASTGTVRSNDHSARWASSARKYTIPHIATAWSLSCSHAASVIASPPSMP